MRSLSRPNAFYRAADRLEREHWTTGTMRSDIVGYDRETGGWVRHGTAYCMLGAIDAEVSLTVSFKQMFANHYMLERFGVHVASYNDGIARCKADAVVQLREIGAEYDRRWWRRPLASLARREEALRDWLAYTAPVRDDLPVIVPNALKVTVPAEWLQEERERDHAHA